MKDYDTKVPEKVKLDNTAKMDNLVKEIAENMKSEEELRKMSK